MFIHDALDELITCGETDIAAGNLRARVNKMHKIVPGKNMSGFSEQFQVIPLASVGSTCTSRHGYHNYFYSC